jgi:S1-C subfamily serine protease
VETLRPAAMALAIASTWGAVALAQDPLRTEDERNTVAVFREASQGVVHVEARAAAESKFEKKVIEAATGSGFLVDRNGRVLTNAHVIDGKNEIEVVLGSGRRLAARLVGTAPQLDLALLQADVPAEELHPLALGDSRTLQVGQKVLAIGNPFGLHDTLTVGTAVELRDALIQTDAAINPGNSGGPLLDSAGKVVGVNAIGSEAQNVGFAIPIHLALRIMEDLVEMGHPYRPQLGFTGLEVTPALARLFGLGAERGYLVQEVLPRSPAAAAGLRAGERVVVSGDSAYVLGGDIVTGANGQPIAGSGDLARLLMELRPGELLRLEVERGGQRHEVVIRLEAMRMQF